MLQHRLVRSNLVFFSGSLLAGFFGYAFQFVAGRLLGPTGYGVVASAFATYNLLAIATLVVLTVTMRHVAALEGAGDQPGLRYLFRRLTVVSLGMGVAVALVYVVVSPLLSGFIRVPEPALLALGPAVLITLAAGVNRGALQGMSRFGWLSAVVTTESAGRAMLAVILILAGFGPTGALAGVSVAFILGYGLGFLPLRPLLGGPMTQPHPMRDVVAFAVPAVAAVGGITFLYNADIILVSHFLGPAAGLYASASTLGRIVYFATISITGVMFPQVSAAAARGGSANRTLELSAMAMIVIAAMIVAVFAILPNLALVPFGAGFHAAAPYLPLFGLAMTFLSLANLLVNYLLASGDRSFVYALGAACVLEVVAITAFHGSLWQVLWSVFTVLGLAVAALLVIYVRRQRLGRAEPASPAA